MKIIIYILIIILANTKTYAQDTKKIIIKFNNESTKSISSIKKQLKNITLHKMFRDTKIKKDNSILSKYYYFYTKNNTIVKQLSKNKNIEYCEEYPKVNIFDSPNDPGVSSQYYISLLNMIDAWAINSGDSTFIIGIVDTGTDLTHDELSPQIALNTADPINGIDDDGDGFIDNFYGWDMSENNNNPQADINDHGVRVSGIAAARVNNQIGIAGVGYNIKFLPVKTMNSSGELNTPYEGLVYAVNHGAKVVVCSWGGVTKSQFAEDIVNYAVKTKDAVIVAAAGNSGNNDIYYPAAFPNVVSVAATNQTDHKWASSTYGYTIDVCAPGYNIYSTTLGNSYGLGSGTSFAAPIVGAIASLIRCQRPTINAIQVMEQLKNTANLIDTIPQNVLYANQLGGGRINPVNALTDTLISGVRIEDITISKTAFPGDTVYLKGVVKNYLKNSAIHINIDFITNYATTPNSSFNVGVLNTFDEFELSENFLPIVIKNNIPYNQQITVIFTISNGIKTYKQFYQFEANPSWRNLTAGNLNISMPSNGRLGFNKLSPLSGDGIWLNNKENMVWAAGLIYGNSSQNIVSPIYDAPELKTISPIKNIENTQTYTKYQSIETDTNLEINQNVNIIQNTFEFTGDEKSSGIIIQYKFINNNQDPIENFHAGLYFDWDLISSHNTSYWDSENEIAFCKNNIGDSLITGVKLRGVKGHQYAFDLINNPEGINITDGFTDEEKWFALTNNRNIAGQGQGNDVSEVIATEALTILPNDTANIIFIIASGFHASNIVSTINNIELFMQDYTSSKQVNKQINSINIYPIPAKNNIYIKSKTPIKIKLISINGDIEYNDLSYSSNKKINISKLKNGIYFIESITKDHKKTINKIIIQH